MVSQGVVFASNLVPASAFTAMMEKQISVENQTFYQLSAYRLYVLQ